MRHGHPKGSTHIVRFDTPQSRTVRWVNGVLAAIYFFVCGMLLYFRLGPFQQVVNRFEDQDTALPSWFEWVFSLGTVLVMLLLLWRGVTTLRRALRP